MMIWRLTSVVILLAGIATLEACTDEAASEQAATVRKQVARVLEETRAADEPSTAGPRAADESDPCADVSEHAVASVEAQMQRLNSDFVVLGAEEMQALACSRSRRGR